MKVISSVVAAVTLAIGALAWNWASTNLVFASDMQNLAAQIAEQVGQQIKPLTEAIEETNKLAQQNAADIKQGRIDQIRAALRGLVAQVNDLENRRDAGGMWTSSDELLLRTWKDDIDDLQRQLATLEGGR